MLVMEVIEPTQAEWASLIFFIPKKCRTFRICVDYHKQSAVMIQDSYMIPRLSECIGLLGDVTIFLTLHANSRHRQV